MKQKKFGYIRVSTREQNEDRQRIAMIENHIADKDIYMDKMSGKDLMGTFLSDIVLTVLSYVAENERKNIRERQAEGIAAAKARGVRFGRPPIPLPDNFEEIHAKWRRKEITEKEAARACNMPVGTFYGKAVAWEKERKRQEEEKKEI
jgi:DNA invertase Pin-like site-specific DNA recombinase